MPHQQPRAVGRLHEILGAVIMRDFPHRAAARGHVAHLVVDRALAVAQEVEAAAVARDRDLRGFPVAVGEPGCASRRPARTGARAAFLAQVPQRAVVGQPAELVELPVDPGVVVQAVARLQFRAGDIHGRDPAVLVVDRAQHHRDVARIAAPADRGRVAVVAAGGDLQRRLPFSASCPRPCAARRAGRWRCPAAGRTSVRPPCRWRHPPATASAAADRCGRPGCVPLPVPRSRIR